ncbi:unnamed protein product [Acidithrix sp. C25]|nr:unnamed protein product [Acidithrix sp. C25]
MPNLGNYKAISDGRAIRLSFNFALILSAQFGPFSFGDM